MKTKTTLHKINDFYTSNKSRFYMIISESFSRKLTPIIIKITLILILVFNTTIAFGQSSSCKADMRVEKDRNVRSTPSEGTYYLMIITNTGTSADTFYLSTLNINSSCSNTDGSSTANNVNLETAFLDANLIAITEISLNQGQSANFFVYVTVPIGIAINNWCCTQVTAKSKSCSDYKVDTILHTLVIDSNED